MKRSARGEQKLDMNVTDFERAAGGRKMKLNFSTFTLDNGFADHDSKQAPLVTDLITVLKENRPAGVLMQYQQFTFSMNMKCQLVISNTTPFIGG